MKLIATLLILIAAATANAQVNAYAKVDAISSTTITVSAQSEAYDLFETGDQLIIMQVQDDVIGTNTGNDGNFGDLSTLASTGMYEVAVISSVIRSGGVVSQIIINSPLSKTFNTGSNSSVQAISFPLLGSNGYTTTSDINALPWNGQYGGVVALRVNGTLTLNHSITADNAGFRGGSINGGNAGSCEYVQFRVAENELNANKGEGIYKSTDVLYAAGRGKILTGGGGGNSHNGGGGGGSNLFAGGEGGTGYGCSLSAGGLGGIPLSAYITTERVFMGGGAGAGEANDGFNSAGGIGGGIVIIKALQVTTSGTGTARISANGQTAANVGNDGAGGGGAGGSILLYVQNWNVAASRPLTVSSNGGSGGNVNDGAFHAGGGGGSQGVIFYSTAIPSINITSNTLLGKGGRNSASASYAPNAAGSDNQGIFSGSFVMLPVKLVYFKGVRSSNVHFEWKTLNEVNISRYELQRSTDGVHFTVIGSVNAKANSSDARIYTYSDNSPLAVTAYYRLRMIDTDGAFAVSSVLTIKVQGQDIAKLSLFPNPALTQASVRISSSVQSKASIRVISMTGAVVAVQSADIHKGENTLSLNTIGRLANGTYQVCVTIQDTTRMVSMTVQK